MRISIHQPHYLPWQGYFQKILRSDLFVFLDTVQYKKNSFMNRNRIKGANGDVWLTIPIKRKGLLDRPLSLVEINNNECWQKKHRRTISQNYSRAPYFHKLMPGLEAFYKRQYSSFSCFAYDMLLFFLNCMDIRTRIVRASELTLPDGLRGSDLILDLCAQFEATEYLSGAYGKEYLHLADFDRKGIGVIFQDYTPPTYPQLYGGFSERMGIIDLLFNTANPLDYI